MKVGYKSIVVLIIGFMLLIFTKIPIGGVYRIKQIESKSGAVNQNNDKPTKEEIEKYKKELVNKNNNNKYQEYDYAISLLDKMINNIDSNTNIPDRAKFNRVKDIVTMLESVNNRESYIKYINKINHDGRYDSIIDFLQQATNDNLDDLKSNVKKVDDRLKQAGTLVDNDSLMMYIDFLNATNYNGIYKSVIEYLKNGGSEYEAKLMARNIRKGKPAETDFKDYIKSINKNGKYNKVIEFLNRGGNPEEAKIMARNIDGFNYKQNENKDYSRYYSKGSIEMGLLESDTYGNIRRDRPYLLSWRRDALRHLRLYSLWEDSHPEMMPEWIVYCAKHGLITLDGSFGFVRPSEIAIDDDDDEKDRDKISIAPRTYTYNRKGDPYDRIPQDVAYAMTYQEKMKREGISQNVMRQIQQTIWNSLTWTTTTNVGPTTTKVTSIASSIEERGKRLSYEGWSQLMFEKASEWDSMKNGLANQVTLPSLKGKSSIASNEEIVTRAEDFANFQYLVGNESLNNKDHVTEVKIAESNIDDSTKISAGNYQNNDNSKIKTFIDQESKTITMGPYKLGIYNTSGNGNEEITNRATKDERMTLADLVRKEVLRRNTHQTKENTFLIGEFGMDFAYKKANSDKKVDSADDLDIETYYGKIAAYQNDTNKYNGKTDKFQLLNSNFQQYPDGEQFPEFGKEFYIRFNAENADRTLVEVKPFIKLLYVNSLNGTSAFYVPESSTYSAVIEGTTSTDFSIKEAAKAAGVIDFRDKRAEGFNFFDGKRGFGDYDTIKDPDSGEIIELSWRKFFSSQEYAKKIMKAIYTNTVNTINARTTSGITIQNKFENAKFGIEILRKQNDPSDNQFYKFDDINDVSKIPTLSYEPGSSSEKTNLVLNLNNVNGGKSTIPHPFLVKRRDEREYKVYDPKISIVDDEWRYIDGLIYYKSMDINPFIEKLDKLGYEFLDKYAKIGFYFDDDMKKAAGQVILKGTSTAQPGSLPSPLKWPMIWYDIDLEREKPYTETRRWKIPDYGEKHLEHNYAYVKIEFPLTGKHTAINLGGNVWQVVQQGKESRKFKLDPSMPEYESLKHNVQGIQVNLFDLTEGTGSLSTDPNAVGKLVATTLTDANGNYGFQLLNPMHKYYVTFTFNGMQFKKTDLGVNSVNDDEANRNTAEELQTYQRPGNDPSQDITTSGRQDENNRFMKISAGSNSYPKGKGGEGKAYGYYSKLKDGNGNYIPYTSHIDNDVRLNSGALRYADALYEMHQAGTHPQYDMTDANTMYKTYTPVGSFSSNYAGIKKDFLARINQTAEGEQVWDYMMDTMVTSRNTEAYPKANHFIIEDLGKVDANGHNHSMDNDRFTLAGKVYEALYKRNYDFARNVDYGIENRVSTDLYLQKDLASARVIVNGTDTKYRYGGKQNVDYANIAIDTGLKTSADQLYNRINDPLYNGRESYSRQIRKSEYLYNAQNVYTNGDVNKNLQVYLTYRIAIKNYGETNASVDEIADYYDSEYLEHNMNNPYVKEGTYFIDRDSDNRGLNPQDGVTATTADNSDASDSKRTLNVPGGATFSYNALFIKGMGEVKAGATRFVYVTFKLKNDDSGRIKLNQDIESGKLKIGVKNLAEINIYSSTESDDAIRGIVDINSIPGSVESNDFDGEGNIITSENPVQNRLENDMDKSPNVVIYVPTNDNNQKVIKGYVFEDQRTNTSNEAVIGNGVYSAKSDEDQKIDGVTVQLVELVKQVDGKGQWTGNYSGEHIWSSKYYPMIQKGNGYVIDDAGAYEDSTRYYSGKVVVDQNGQNVVQSKVMISGDPKSTGKLLYVPPITLSQDGGKGAYAFSSIVSGDYLVRYIYGDTTQTVLVNDENAEVNRLLNTAGASQTGAVDVNSIIMNNDNKYVSAQNGNDGFTTTSNDKVIGLNNKSYNGQDYKSTVYQKGIMQDPTAANRLGIREFSDYDNQNYSENGKISLGTNKNVMYYYNIAKGDTQKDISDAKDVEAFRKYVNAYSNGDTLNTKGVRNELNEILRSFEKVSTNTIKNGTNSENTWNTEAQRKQQIAMLKELMRETKMVAQSGIIDIETEYNRNDIDGQADKKYRFNTWNSGNGENYDLGKLPKLIAADVDLVNTVDDLDLGLVQRPEAQLKLTKNVANFKLVLANGTTMFDAQPGQSVNNLYFGKHNGHTAEYDNKHEGKFNLNPKGLRLTNVHVNKKNGKNTPELVQGYMDDELMDGSDIEITYDLTVENVGEVDYLDNQFYYTGVTKDARDENKSKTAAKQIVDYVTNSFKFDKNSQNSDGQNWKIRNKDELIVSNRSNNYKDDLVNRVYNEELSGYTTLLTTDGLSTELVPQAGNNKGQNKVTGSLKLSTLVSSTKNANDLVYNNLSEIVETSNSLGRRAQYSINGNQRMSDQTVGANAISEIDENDNRYNQFTPVDLVNPAEIDADSAQKIVLLPPTGENRDYIKVVIPVIIGLSLIMAVIIIISVKAIKGKK